MAGSDVVGLILSVIVRLWVVGCIVGFSVGFVLSEHVVGVNMVGDGIDDDNVLLVTLAMFGVEINSECMFLRI